VAEPETAERSDILLSPKRHGTPPYPLRWRFA
jgi:hypothetical protein